VKEQLEESGLFTVNLQSTLYDVYRNERVQDAYPAYQLGWFPDYSDADNYLTPFFLDGGFLLNHYSNPEVNSLITEQLSETDEDARADLIGEIQDKVAADLSTVPLLQGAQVAVSGTDVKGVTLDASFKFRYAPLTK
jgi:peptide/nickel transport system substrate-binding protein